MTTRTSLLSLDEFLRQPETEPYTELIEGKPCQKPVGKTRHARAQGRLIRLLVLHPATSEGEAVPEQGFRFPSTTLGNLRVPDVAYYRANRRPSTEEDYPAVAPDLAAEIRSAGQGKRGQRERLAFLREQGTICTLLVDPEDRTVEVHDGERTWVAGTGDEVTLRELGGFSFRVGELFD